MGDPAGDSRGEFWRVWEALGQATAPSRSANTAEKMEPCMQKFLCVSP